MSNPDRATLVLAGAHHEVLEVGHRGITELPPEDAAPEALPAVDVLHRQLEVNEFS